MKRSSPRSGRWEKQPVKPESFTCFIPAPLPPNPPIQWDEKLQTLHEKANRALGKLDAVAYLIPDYTLLLYTYVRKEAVLSSQIEGTQSSLSDLLVFENKEAPGVPIEDVKEVSNYVAALQYGLKKLQGGFPLSLRLLKEMHAVLLKGGRGGEKEPGEFRRSQNWIGGSRPGNARFVPPPPHEVMPAMGALEKFLHGIPSQTPTLLKAGLAHAQFETIHPFWDGNGRLGRLLITLILCAEEALTQPMLYLSLYFKTRHQEYYDVLQRIRTDGDWEGWLAFYFDGVAEVSERATKTAHTIFAMFEKHQHQIQTLGKGAASALKVQNLLKKRCIISVNLAKKELGLTFPTINDAISKLEKLGLVREFTGKRRHRLFCYQPYLNILSEET